MNCAIIGSTKIAEVHIHFLIKNGIKQFCIISRSKKKRFELVNKLKKNFKNINFYEDKLDVLRKKYFDIIDICSSNYAHDIHLNYISGLKSLIIVEKPFVSILKLKKNYLNYINKIYKNNKKILVCYPMIYLSKEFSKLFKIQKGFKNIEFNFNTGGSYKYKKNIENLMPHALSFIDQFIKINRKTKFIVENIKIEKNKAFYKLKIKKKILDINLSEYPGTKTILSVKIDKNKIIRITKHEKKKFLNILKFNKRFLKIKNPMEELFKDIFDNLNNSSFYKQNKELTINIMKLNYKMMI